MIFLIVVFWLNTTWKWVMSELGGIAFPGNGIPALTSEQKRICELEKRLKDVEMERDILKKAMAIFSRTQRGSMISLKLTATASL